MAKQKHSNDFKITVIELIKSGKSKRKILSIQFTISTKKELKIY